MLGRLRQGSQGLAKLILRGSQVLLCGVPTGPDFGQQSLQALHLRFDGAESPGHLDQLGLGNGEARHGFGQGTLRHGDGPRGCPGDRQADRHRDGCGDCRADRHRDRRRDGGGTRPGPG